MEEVDEEAPEADPVPEGFPRGEEMPAAAPEAFE